MSQASQTQLLLTTQQLESLQQQQQQLLGSAAAPILLSTQHLDAQQQVSFTHYRSTTRALGQVSCSALSFTAVGEMIWNGRYFSGANTCVR